MKKLILFTLISMASLNSYAEYRAYQYYVRSRYPSPFDKKTYIVTSTLDPVSYLSYHGGEEAISTELIRSWMCKGHTAKLRPCPSPLEKSNLVANEAE